MTRLNFLCFMNNFHNSNYLDGKKHLFNVDKKIIIFVSLSKSLCKCINRKMSFHYFMHKKKCSGKNGVDELRKETE